MAKHAETLEVLAQRRAPPDVQQHEDENHHHEHRGHPPPPRGLRRVHEALSMHVGGQAALVGAGEA